MCWHYVTTRGMCVHVSVREKVSKGIGWVEVVATVKPLFNTFQKYVQQHSMWSRRMHMFVLLRLCGQLRSSACSWHTMWVHLRRVTAQSFHANIVKYNFSKGKKNSIVKRSGSFASKWINQNKPSKTEWRLIHWSQVGTDLPWFITVTYSHVKAF